MAPKLGRYHLLGLLGRGGSGGVVYLARRGRFGGPVALKVPGPLAQHTDAQVLLREIALHSQLDHPRVVKVLESGMAEGIIYFALEYAPGGTLQHLIAAEGRLSVGQTLTVVMQLAEALEYAHNAVLQHQGASLQGILHRDIKPQNIYLDGRGGVKLGDFGIAKPFDAGYTITAGGFPGTPPYMAPEQFVTTDAEGRHVRPTGATDVWQLAVVTYEMLTGTRPFGPYGEGEDTIVVVTRILNSPPKDPRRANPSLNAGVTDLLLEALDKDPSKRPGAMEFARRLRDLSGASAQRLPASAPADAIRVQPLTETVLGKMGRSGDRHLNVFRVPVTVSSSPAKKGLLKVVAALAAMFVLLLTAAVVLLWIQGHPGGRSSTGDGGGGGGGTIMIPPSPPAGKKAVVVRPVKMQGTGRCCETALDMLSADAVLFAYADVRGLLATPALRQTAEGVKAVASEDRELRELFSAFTKTTGLDPLRDVSEVAVLVRGERGEDVVVLAQADWDSAKMVKFISDLAKLPASVNRTANGTEIWGWGRRDTPEVGLAFPAGGLLLVGRYAAVEEMIERREKGVRRNGDRHPKDVKVPVTVSSPEGAGAQKVPDPFFSAVAGEVREAFNRGDPAAPFRMAWRLPSDVRQEFRREASRGGSGPDGIGTGFADGAARCRSFVLSGKPEGGGLSAVLTCLAEAGEDPAVLVQKAGACRKEAVDGIERGLADDAGRTSPPRHGADIPGQKEVARAALALLKTVAIRLRPEGVDIGVAAPAQDLLATVRNIHEWVRCESCQSHMHYISWAVKEYSRRHGGRFPPSLGALLKEGDLGNAEALLCPCSAHRVPADFPRDLRNADLDALDRVDEFGDYVVVKGAARPADEIAVVIYEKNSAHGRGGRNVLDEGGARWRTEQEFRQILSPLKDNPRLPAGTGEAAPARVFPGDGATK